MKDDLTPELKELLASHGRVQKLLKLYLEQQYTPPSDGMNRKQLVHILETLPVAACEITIKDIHNPVISFTMYQPLVGHYGMKYRTIPYPRSDDYDGQRDRYVLEDYWTIEL